MTWLRTLGLLAGAVLFSCSPSTPKILQEFSRITWYQDSLMTSPRESMSLFLHVENQDGFEDLEKIYVLNDQDEVYWTLGPGSWQRRDRGTEIWIGSNFLQAPGSDIPRGEYRILLQTRSGERGRKVVYFDSPKLSAYRGVFPVFSLDETGISLKNPPATYEIWVAGSDGQTLYNFKGNGQSRLTFQDLLPTEDLRQRARQFTFHRFEDKLGISIVLGPYLRNP